MAEKFWFPSRSQPGPLLHSVDRSGRPIHPDVLTSAGSIAVRAIQFAERLVNDPALATSLLEESAASVSRVVSSRAQLGKPPIANLEAYLFRAFIRKVNIARRKQIAVSSAMTLPDLSPDGLGYADKLELKILIDEFVTRCDPVTRDMFYRRVQGFSWKEIGKAYEISAHAAEARFSQQLKKVRRRLGLR